MDSSKTLHCWLHDVALYIVIMFACCSMLAYCPRHAFADDADTGAGEVWQQYTDESITSFGLRQRVTKDLGWRWFNSENQSKIPLVPTNYSLYKTLPQYLDEYGSASAAYDAFAKDVDSDFIVSRFALVTYENEYDTWGVGDSWSEQHYKEWYNYLNGIVEGGSGDEPTIDGNMTVYTMNTKYNNNENNVLLLSGTQYVWNVNSSGNVVIAPSISQLRVPTSYVDDFKTANPNKSYGVVYAALSSSSPVWNLIALDSGSYQYTDDSITSNVNGNTYPSTKVTLTNVIALPLTTEYVISGDNLISTVTNKGSSKTRSVSNKYVRAMMIVGVTGGSGGGPVIPPVIYPPEIVPSTPTQPTAPTDPTYTGNTYNIVNNVTNQTTGTTTDLTPILEAIRIVNNNLDEFEQNIIDALDNLWSNMRGYFDAWFTDISNWLDIVSTQLQQWGTQLDGDLQMVNTWLRRIFEKLRGGAAADRPDITIKEDDFWDWLDVLFQKLLDALPDSISDFITELNRLTGRFPFSVPWDLAFLLGLLSHQPVTPVFSFWLPSVGLSGLVVQGTQVTVDMSPFDDVAALARRCELILFAVGLAKMTVSTIRDVDWTMYG